jgi:aryl-alcohol dehydrogenase-like predicted oxidoreductase
MHEQKNLLSNVILGTAQLGLNYGISNVVGSVLPEEAKSVLEAANAQNISLLDTAQAYGNSENVIGQYKKSIFEVQTKIGAFPPSESDWFGWLQKSISQSKQLLGHHQLKTVFMHDTKQLLGAEENKAKEALSNLVRVNLGYSFGASLYEPLEWEKLKKVDEISVFQVPFSIFDRRFEAQIQEMLEMNKQVQVRSVFLQGLLLMNPDTLPDYFSPWREVLLEFQEFCYEKKITKVTAAAGFALQVPNLSGVVIGFHERKQLVQLSEDLRNSDIKNLDYPTFGKLEAALLDPRKWPKP